MYLGQRLYRALADVDDSAWQLVLERQAFWRRPGARIDDEHQDIAFHILMHEGELARPANRAGDAHEFDAVGVPLDVFDDAGLCAAIAGWSAMHEANYGSGVTTKMGLYVIRAGGSLGFHVDGPVFLRGERVDLSLEHVQRGLIEAQASHRTVLPLRFNEEDAFMLCAHKAPMKRGELFEFSNVLPHAYFNRGREHAVLLVTTYLEEAWLPEEVTYGAAPAAAAGRQLEIEMAEP